MAQSDEELLRACRRGDEAAWEALVRRYQRLVYAVPRRAGLDEDAAADVFQDVFATLLENVERVEQPSRLHAWLVTTARRKTWLAIRRSRRTRSLDDAEGEEDEVSNIRDEGLLPDEVLGQLEEQHLVRAALAELDERCRRLLTMLFCRADTPPYSEIAAALGTSEGSIGPTRARCLKKLLGALNKGGLFRPAVE
jgi:RNA polymerase sigma factor (sigma-70 family)